MLSRLNTTAAVQVRASRHKTPKEPKGSCSLSRDTCPLPNKATPGPTTLSPCVCVFPTQYPDRRTTRWSHHLKHVCLANGGLRSLVLQHPPMRCTSHLHAKRDSELHELDLAQGLREDVGSVVVRRDRENLDVARFSVVVEKVDTSVDVLGAFARVEVFRK